MVCYTLRLSPVVVRRKYMGILLWRMLFEDLPLCIVKLLPVEIWKIVHKFYVKKCLLDHLHFPTVLNRRINDDFFADYWQAYCGGHRWDIETGNEVSSTLISHFFNHRRSSIDWSGIMMLMGERVFGIGFNINNLFMNSIFTEDDDEEVPYFPRIAWTNYDSDDSFLLEE
ncbi:MAG: hypothetical protein ACO3UU_14365 [Minisyncoccia bacterium]